MHNDIQRYANAMICVNTLLNYVNMSIKRKHTKMYYLIILDDMKRLNYSSLPLAQKSHTENELFYEVFFF